MGRGAPIFFLIVAACGGPRAPAVPDAVPAAGPDASWDPNHCWTAMSFAASTPLGPMNLASARVGYGSIWCPPDLTFVFYTQPFNLARQPYIEIRLPLPSLETATDPITGTLTGTATYRDGTGEQRSETSVVFDGTVDPLDVSSPRVVGRVSASDAAGWEFGVALDLPNCGRYSCE